MPENCDNTGPESGDIDEIEPSNSSSLHIKRESGCPIRGITRGERLIRVRRSEASFLVSTTRGSIGAQGIINCKFSAKPDTASSPLASGQGGGESGSGGDGDGKSDPPPEPIPVLFEETKSTDTELTDISIEDIFGPDGLSTIPPPKLYDPGKLDIDSARPDSGTESRIAISSVPPVIKGKVHQDISTDEELEDWQKRTIDDLTPEERGAFMQASILLKQGSGIDDSRARQILESAGLLGYQKYDQVYDDGVHGYSTIPTEHELKQLEESDFMKSFLKRIKIDEDPVIADLGCGTGAASIVLARKGIRVIAVDSSKKATQMLSEHIAGTDIEDLIKIRHERLKAYFGNPDHEVTDMLAKSLFHLFTPGHLSETIFPQINSILQRSGGCIGYNMKTYESSSASTDTNLRLTHDKFHCSLHKKYGIFKIFPEETMVERLSEKLLEPLAIDTEVHEGYDLRDEKEYFRYVVAKSRQSK